MASVVVPCGGAIWRATLSTQFTSSISYYRMYDTKIIIKINIAIILYNNDTSVIKIYHF